MSGPFEADFRANLAYRQPAQVASSWAFSRIRGVRNPLSVYGGSILLSTLTRRDPNRTDQLKMAAKRLGSFPNAALIYPVRIFVGTAVAFEATSWISRFATGDLKRFVTDIQR